MFTFEEFQKINRSHWDENEMKKNYTIALKVEANYYNTHGTAQRPKLGDIVEYTDGWEVFTGASIVENLYYSEPKICICDHGSSFTHSGKKFCTSGGAFHSKDASLLQYVGEAINIVWTWGCNGAGANQGINIPLKVNKWIIPYNTFRVKRSIVNFNNSEVWIENTGEWFKVHSFESIEAFEAWATYVGYKYYMDGEKGFSHQKLVTRCWIKADDKPKDGKPIKVLANGKIHDGYVTKEETSITEWWENKPYEYHPYGSPKSNREIQDFWKYNKNPMGI